MSRESWALIKNRKSFNVLMYRRGLALITISTLLSLSFSIIMFYKYIHLAERDYYATSGMTPPIKLAPILAPNMSDKALLDPDPPTDDIKRPIPQ